MADTRLGKIGITVKEPWAVDISYEALDMTLYTVADGGDGCSYVALKDNIGITPGTDPTTWVKSTQAGQSIYDLAVKYKHFEGTEEEFEAEYQAVLQAARAAAAGASAVESQVEAAEAARVTAENARVSAEAERASAETARQTAETSRATAETARQSAESNRGSAETARQSAETARESAETTRQSNESARESAELTRTQQFQALKTDMQTAIQNVDAKAAEIAEDIEGYEQNEAGRVSAEQGRVAAETARETAESARQSAEQGRATAEGARATAETARADAEGARVTAEQARATAEQGRASAESNRVSAENARVAAETARESASATAVQNAEEATEAANTAAEAAGALQESLESGEVIPALAENLESWEEDVSEVQNSWNETIRSTAGDEAIDTNFGGVLRAIVAETDFSCDSLIATPYNQLRLASNGGGAVALGAGYYFPVPHLELGAFGDATKNNGLILTARDKSNIKNAVVRFQPLANGAPTSLNDGSVCSYQDVTYNEETYRTYLTSGEGWLIVSGITWADTCAHLAWEDWYDRFIAPNDPNDVGDTINVAPIFAATPNGTGKFLVITSGSATVSTRADRTDATHMRITDPVARLTNPAWVNTLKEDGETYLHSLVISAMKSGGLAVIEGSNQALTVEGTTVSYTDTEETAISGVVRYELATPATANVALTKTSYALNDCGVEMKNGAVGKAYFICLYSQNVADALSQIAKVRLNSSLTVTAEALNNLDARVSALEGGGDKHETLKAKTVDATELTAYDLPRELWGAGAPSASAVPSNWPAGVPWDGIPAFRGQCYNDTTNKKVYKAFGNTAVADWVLLN